MKKIDKHMAPGTPLRLGDPRSLWVALGLLTAIVGVMGPARAAMKPEQEYAKHVDRSRKLTPMTEFGDQINLRDGSLIFRATDVELTGIGPTIRITRSFRPSRASDEYRETTGHSFGQWELEIPRVKTITANALGVTPMSPKGWQVNNVDEAYRNQRCKNFDSPGRITFVNDAGRAWNPSEWWDGYYVVDSAGNEQPLMSRTSTSVKPDFPLMTTGNWLLNCLPATTSGEKGDAFYAVAPDGTKYWFDYLVYQQADTLQKPLWTKAPVSSGAASAPSSAATGRNSGLQPTLVNEEDYLERRYAAMLVTKIEDRFGNKVVYNYSAGRLTSIEASDGRRVNITFDPSSGQISAVSAGSGSTLRTWNYSYAGSSLGVAALTVTQPDHSTWQYSLPILQSSALNVGANASDCTVSVNDYDLYASGSITSPAGATMAFKVNRKRFARSYVPKQCWGGDPTRAENGQAVYPREWYAWAIESKTITGPGLTPLTWRYAYAPPVSSWYSECATPTSCASTVWTDVTNPQGHRHRSIFSNKFDETENQLVRDEDYGADGSLLRSIDHAYATVPAGGVNPYPWPFRVGNDKRTRVNALTSGQWRPERHTVITQGGVTFTRTVNKFHDYMQPKDVTRTGPGGSRNEVTTYVDDYGLWVIGQVDKVTSGGLTMLDNGYNAKAQLDEVTKFGVLEQTLTYNPDGTLASRKDGRGNVTSFSNYKLGIPQSVSYPNGSSESARVDDLGWVSSVTDASGAVTDYGYDQMGRLTSLKPPTGWNPTLVTFDPVPFDEYGLSAGHWKQTVTKGKAVTETYFDGLWRPQMTRVYDSNDPGGTRKVVTKQYDADGRTTFESYPQRDATSVTGKPAGKTVTYDALGRVLTQVADSELGPLTTRNQYLSGFKTQTTNPRGLSTTQTFWALDNPGEAQLAGMVAPEGVTVQISRDVFGKPTSIRRFGSAKGYSADVTRSYVYGNDQRLCKTVEPEVGATIQAYDASGNVQWRAPGQKSLSSLSTCDLSSVPASGKISYGYDAVNLLTSVSYGDGSPGVTRSYTPDGLLETISSNGSTWKYRYNSLRVLTQETLNYGGQDYTLGWSIDGNGNPSALTYPDGRTAVAYSPNALGELQQVGDFAKGVKYWPNGAVADYTLGNGIKHNQTQNLRGLPLLNTDGTVLSDQYAYDANGNVTAITDQRVSPSDGNASRVMTYDDLDRLATTQAPGAWGTATYLYDPVDNIRSSIVGARSSTLEYESNRLSKMVTNGTTISYGYDALGNIRTKGGQTFLFDLGNRLQTATTSSSYVYDGHGRRVVAQSTEGGKRLQVYSQAGQLLWAERSGTGTVPATISGYTCASGQLSGTDCVTTTTYPATVTGYTCNPGDTRNGSTCTGTTTYAATTTLTCPKGGSLTGTTCNIAASSYAAKVNYSCPDGGSLSGTNCVRNEDYVATLIYSCPAGGTLSGTNCLRNADYTATLTYTCPDGSVLSGTNCVRIEDYSAIPVYNCAAGDTLSGSTCTHKTAVSATPVYTCPSDYTLSGTTCTRSTSVTAASSYDCNGLGGVSAYGGGPGGKACQDQIVEPVLSVPEAMAECMNQHGYAGLTLITAKFKVRKAYTCVFAPTVTYSCPGGGSLSGSQCVSTSTVAASLGGYACASGELSGSSCIISSTYGASVDYVCSTGGTLEGMMCRKSTTKAATQVYSCPEGGTLEGTMCRKTASYAANVGYDCPSGGTLEGTMCRKSTTKAALLTYSCPDGGTLSGSICVVAASTYPATVSSTCPNGGTLSNGICTKTSTYAATPSTSCKAGDTASGSQCSHVDKVPATPTYTCKSGTVSGSNCLNASMQAKTAYVYLGGKQIAEVDVTAGVTQYVHTDALGSPVAHTNASGVRLNWTRFEPYGYASNNAPAGSTMPGPTVSGKVTTGSAIGYTGHVNDPETELVYMQQRYYDPIAGRFLSVDPVVTDANTGKGFGLYTYVDNNPYAKIDPDGRDPEHSYIPKGMTFEQYRAANEKAGGIAIAGTAAVALAVPLAAQVSGTVIAVGTDFAASGSLAGAVVANAPAVNATAITVAEVAAGGTAGTVAINTAQAKNIARFTSKLPANAKANVALKALPSGGVAAQGTSAGRVPGSSAVYEKQIDAAGITRQYTKTTYDPSGNIVHVKDKMNGEEFKP